MQGKYGKDGKDFWSTPSTSLLNAAGKLAVAGMNAAATMVAPQYGTQSANAPAVTRQELLQPIADALGMRFYIGYDSQGDPKLVGRDNSRPIPLLPGISVNSGMGLRAQYMGLRTASVLVKVKRHLFAFCSYWHAKDVVILLLVDWSKTDCPTDDDIRKEFDGRHPKDIMPRLVPATVAAYTKRPTEKEWESLEVSSLDLRSSGDDKPSSWPASQW